MGFIVFAMDRIWVLLFNNNDKKLYVTISFLIHFLYYRIVHTISTVLPLSRK